MFFAIDSINYYKSKYNIKEIVFIGDILSYGVRINETITFIENLRGSNNCIFISSKRKTDGSVDSYHIHA